MLNQPAYHYRSLSVCVDKHKQHAFPSGVCKAPLPSALLGHNNRQPHSPPPSHFIQVETVLRLVSSRNCRLFWGGRNNTQRRKHNHFKYALEGLEGRRPDRTAAHSLGSNPRVLWLQLNSGCGGTAEWSFVSVLAGLTEGTGLVEQDPNQTATRGGPSLRKTLSAMV